MYEGPSLDVAVHSPARRGLAGRSFTLCMLRRPGLKLRLNMFWTRGYNQEYVCHLHQHCLEVCPHRYLEMRTIIAAKGLEPHPKTILECSVESSELTSCEG